MKRVLLSAAAAAILTVAVPSASFAADAPIFAALKANNWTAAQALVNAETAKAVDEVGNTPLIYAVHAGNADLVKALLTAGADPKAPSPLGILPMVEAVRSGDGATIGALLDPGAEVDSFTSPTNVTLLMVMARTGNAAGVKALIAHGADVNAAETGQGQTALMWAAESKQPDIVRMLLAAGARPDTKTKFVPVPTRVDTEPRVNHSDSWGSVSALMIAARSGCVDCARAIIEAGGYVDIANPDFVTPLIYATLNANWDTAKYLVEAGADMDHFDWWGRNAVYAIVDYNVVPKGGHADRPSLDDTPPLELLEMMLKRGANPNLRLKYIQPYRNIGVDRGGELALAAGATPLLRAAKVGDVEATRLLLQYGAKVDAQNWRAWRDEVEGLTPVLVAAGGGAVVIDTRGKDKTQAQAIEILKLLVAAGADINYVDPRGHNAVHDAVMMGYNDVLKWLLQNGANPYVADVYGMTPMDMARKGAIDAFRGQQVQITPEAVQILTEFSPPQPTAAALP